MKIKEYITEKEKDELTIYGIINVLEKYCKPFLKHMKRVGLKDWFYRGSDKVSQKKMVRVKPRKNRMTKDMEPEMQEYLDEIFYGKFNWRPRSEGIFTTSSKNDAKNYGHVGLFIPIGKKYSFVYNTDIIDLWSLIDDYNLYPPDEDRIKNNLYNSSQIEDEYEYEYGENTDGGTWYYDNEDTYQSEWSNARYKVSEEFIDIEDEDERDLMIDDSLFEWTPEISYDEYIDSKIDNRYNEITDNLDGYIDGYTDKNLRKAHSSKVEVTFKCKEYFLVGEQFDDILTDHFLIGNPQKPDFWQKKFDFEEDYMFKYFNSK